MDRFATENQQLLTGFNIKFFSDSILQISDYSIFWNLNNFGMAWWISDGNLCCHNFCKFINDYSLKQVQKFNFRQKFDYAKIKKD